MCIHFIIFEYASIALEREDYAEESVLHLEDKLPIRNACVCVVSTLFGMIHMYNTCKNSTTWLWSLYNLLPESVQIANCSMLLGAQHSSQCNEACLLQGWKDPKTEWCYEYQVFKGIYSV